MHARLPRIPTPPSRAWRRWQARFLPLAAFAAAITVIVMLWTRWAAPPTLVAEAETIRADVRAPQPGSLAGLKVALLQPVAAGEIVAHVVTTDLRIVQASLAVLSAELEVMRATMKPVLDQQRVALDVDRLHLDWMSERVKLASLEAQLQLAESTLGRIAGLYQSRMISDERFEEATHARDALRDQVKVQTEMIAAIEPRLREYGPEGGHVIPSGNAALRAAINLHEEKLRLAEAQLSPVPLTAPIDGIVTQILRRPGETIAAGEPVVQICAENADRLVGYVRQPVTVEPRPGMTVEVRTRSQQRQVTTATVVQVGRHMEPIPLPLLAAMQLADSPESGLRIHFTPPVGLTLRPGEHVDVTIRN
jgi:multidrug resistance efflux pump